ncbi:MAG: S-layer homology domain-containing protein [Oscillospiraceae bacterium]|nr:S-layer homology domain-containing protein [Oscillospiraceae bacterium]
MNNLKRVLSLALSTVMLVGMMAMGASAADFTDAEKIQHSEAVNVLVALKVINGQDDGSFNPGGDVTRAQMAKMIAVAMNGGSDTNTGVKTNPSFTDVKGHWAESYIEYCYDMGIISGRGDGTFDPEGKVTGTEAAKMVLTALGYAADAYQLTGATWATRTNELAKTADPGLYEELGGVVMSNSATRDTAAQIIWNGLQNTTKRVRPTTGVNTGSIEWTYEDGDMLLKERYGAQIFVGTFEGNDKFGASGLAEGEIQIKGRLNGAPEFAADGVTPTATANGNFPFDLPISYIGEEFKVIFKDGQGGTKNVPDKRDTVYGVFNTNSKTVYNITKADLQDAKDEKANGRIKFGDTLYDVVAPTQTAVVIYRNYNTAIKGSDIKATACTAADAATYINDATNGLRVKSTDPIKVVADDNGKIEKLYVEDWTYASILSKTSSKIQIEGVGSKDLKDVNMIDEVKADDIVSTAVFYANSKAQTQVKKAETIQGVVEAIDGTKLRIDGTWYDKSANAETLGDYDNALVYSVGDEYELVLDGEKYYVAGDTISAETNYAMVLAVSEGINDQAKLLLADGTEKVYTVNATTGFTIDSSLVSSLNTASNAFMVKYELVKSGAEVKMTKVADVTDSNTTGEDHSFNKNTKVLTTYNASAKTEQVVSNDAVGFVFADGKWKVYNANTTSNITGVDQTKAFVGTKGGKVVAFALQATATPSGAADKTSYGYVVGKIQTTYGNDKDKVTELTIWDGEEEVKVLVDTANSTAGKGDFVKFAISSAPVSDTEVSTVSGTNVKVKEHDKDRNLLITTTDKYGVNGVVKGNDTVYRLNSDTVVIGVKVADKKASENNTIQTYTKITEKDFNNAKVVVGTGGDEADLVKAIYVDEDGKIDGNGASGVAYDVALASTPIVVSSGDTTYPVADWTVSIDKEKAIDNEKVTLTVTYKGSKTDDNDTLTITPSATSGADNAVAAAEGLTGIKPNKTWTCTIDVNGANVVDLKVTIAVSENT